MINMYPTIAMAIFSLVNGAQYSMIDDDYDQITWFDERTKPTKSAVETELARLIAAYEAAEYARNRAKEYPAIGDQLDALFHAGVFPEAMAAQIQAIKTKYPKV
jgi:hypothetical protein